tara:strand:- start:1790 stop:2536 length:747 start_codon:yes stop_codon:yes gene_type:complete
MRESTLRITLHKQNLLSQKKGVVIIPVNNFFDTHLGDGVVCPKTIHGQFLKMCNIPPDELSKLIHHKFKRKHNLFNEKFKVLHKNVDRNLDGKTPYLNLNNTSYPLGSSILLSSKDIGVSRGQEAEAEYLLFALTEFDHNNKVTNNIGDTMGAISTFLQEEMDSGRSFPSTGLCTYKLPFLGSGKGGLTEIESLSFMLTSAPFYFLKNSVNFYGKLESFGHFDINIFHNAKPEMVQELNKIIQKFGVN